MFKPTPEQLKEILTRHKLWLDGKLGGVRAYLRNADLFDADLRYANLRYANLRGANMPTPYWLVGTKFHQLSGPACELDKKKKYVVWDVEIA